MNQQLAKLVIMALITAAWGLTAIPAAADTNVMRNVAPVQQAAPPAPQAQQQAQPQAVQQQQQQPQQQQPRPVTPDLSGYWSQQGGLYYQLIKGPGNFPTSHNHRLVMVRKATQWVVPWQVGTVCCVFTLNPGANKGPGMVLNVDAAQGVHWINCTVNVVGPNELSVQPTDPPLPHVALKRVQSVY